MQMILAAVDFSSATARVTQKALELADGGGGVVRLVHVATPDPVSLGSGQAVAERIDASLARDRARLSALADELRAGGARIETASRTGDAVEAILAEAATAGADVIVIGYHGHGALLRTLLGSVSEGVLRRASCPVLVIPPDRG